MLSGEALAASTTLPIGSYVSIPHLAEFGLPTDYRIADRGHLAGNQIDVLIWTGAVAPSVQLAYAVSGTHDACVY